MSTIHLLHGLPGTGKSTYARILQTQINGVILDHGFWTRASRDQARAKVKEIGATYKLYEMICPSATADARVLKRNQNLHTGELRIDQPALDLFRTRYKPLGSKEECVQIDTSTPEIGRPLT